MLLDTPKKFYIIKQQVLACAVDNALSMTQNVQLVNEEEEDNGNEHGEDECEDTKEVENTEDSITIDQSI